MSRDMRRTKIPGWYEFYRIACPICGKNGGCMQHKDGNKVVCIRVESKTVFSKYSAIPSYLHYLNGEKKRKPIDDSLVEAAHSGEKKKDNETLHEVFKAMIDVLHLEDTHYSQLTSPLRGLTDYQITMREYRSFPDKPWLAVKAIENEYGIKDFTGIPGFYQQEGKYGKYWNISGTKGMLIPYRNYCNQIVGFQYRVDNPPNDVVVQDRIQGLGASVKEQPNLVQVHFEGEILFERELEIGETIPVYRNGDNTNTSNMKDLLGFIKLKKGNRYYWLSSVKKPKGTSSGDPAPVHVSIPTKRLETWRTGEKIRTKKVWLSEGPLKTDIATDLVQKLFEPEEIERYGDVFLALPGVNAWRLALPILKDMGVEEINMCFDADIVNNPQVRAIFMGCLKELKEEGYHVNMVIWNGDDGKGIDDLLLNNKVPQFKSLF